MGRGRDKKRKDRQSSSDDSYVEERVLGNTLSEKRKQSKIRKQEEGLDEASEPDIGLDSELVMGEPTLASIVAKLDKMANKDDLEQLKADLRGDIGTLRSDMERVFASMTRKVEVLESRVFETEKIQDELTNALEGVKNENLELKKEVERQKTALTDLEQYGRRNNIKIYNLEEKNEGGGGGETSEETARAVLSLCNSTLGMELDEKDIEIAHRLPHRETGKRGPRSVVVRFTRRCVRHAVIKKRNILKGTPIVLADDLCPFNLNIFHKLRKALGTRAVWSREGRIFARVNGEVKEVNGVNVAGVIEEARVHADQMDTADADARAPGGRGVGQDGSGAPRSSPRGFGRGRVARGGHSH